MYEEREEEDVAVHMSTTDARSGSPTRMTRNILIVSVMLVVVMLALALGFGFFETDQTGADKVNVDNAATGNVN